MCGRNPDQDLPWTLNRSAMSTEDPSGNRGPPQLNTTIEGRNTNVQHERDRNVLAGSDATHPGNGIRETIEAQNVETTVKFELGEGNYFQIAPDPHHSYVPRIYGRLDGHEVLAIVERKIQTTGSSVSPQASTPRMMTPEPVILSERIPGDLAVFAAGTWGNAEVNLEG